MNTLFEGLESMQSHGIPRVITERLQALNPGRHVLVTHDGLFRVAAWAHSGAGTREPIADSVAVDLTSGHRDEFHLGRHSGR